MTIKTFGLLPALAGLVMLSAARASEITFYYPVAVGGPVTKIIDAMAADFETTNPDVKVKPVYAGSYQDTITKVLTAVKAGSAPQFSVLLSTDMFTLIDEHAIVPLEEVAKGADDREWLDSFYPGFMANSQTGGKTWGVPFQRSTIVQFWNKDKFRQVGLDPERAPQDWDEMVTFAQKLTQRDPNGQVVQWGVQIPSSGFPYWLFQGLTTQNDARLANLAGTEVYLDQPAVVEALQYWMDLSAKYKVHPPGIVEWGTTPKDFLEGRAAMIWTTTGNLTNIRANAKFDFGVGMLPAHRRRGSPTGGGNFYIFKQATEEQRQAALRFIIWATAPERAAQWAAATGYVAVTPAAWKTDALLRYIESFPAAAVARDQLQFAVAEFSTHDNQRVTKVFNDNLQAALSGQKTAQAAMRDAQRDADTILKTYR